MKSRCTCDHVNHIIGNTLCGENFYLLIFIALQHSCTKLQLKLLVCMLKACQQLVLTSVSENIRKLNSHLVVGMGSLEHQ